MGKEPGRGLAGTSRLGLFTKASIKRLVTAMVSSKGLTGGESAYKLLAGFTSLKAIGLRTSVSHWLLVRGQSKFLAMWTSP